MNRPTFDLDALDLDRLEWFDTETYHPPAANVWLVSRWESRVVEGLYAVSAVYYDGKSWYNADGEEVEVIEFAEADYLCIKEIPSADVKPVVRGEWLNK